MTIRKRKANLGDVEHRGRHKLLKLGSPHLTIYQYIKNHPGCIRREIAEATPLPADSISKRTAELIHEGLVVEIGKRKDEKTGRTVALLHISGSNEMGIERDKLKINLKIYRGQHGGYAVQASIMNFEQSTFDVNSLVLNKDITVLVPKPTEPMALQTYASKEGSVIEADYEEV